MKSKLNKRVKSSFFCISATTWHVHQGIHWVHICIVKTKPCILFPFEPIIFGQVSVQWRARTHQIPTWMVLLPARQRVNYGTHHVAVRVAYGNRETRTMTITAMVSISSPVFAIGLKISAPSAICVRDWSARIAVSCEIIWEAAGVLVFVVFDLVECRYH